MMDTTPLFDRLAMIDPVSGLPLEPIITARTPAGVPIWGALRIQGTDRAYPIVDCVARLTPELAKRHARWLEPLGLRPPDANGDLFQLDSTVESFGFQWSWNADMRSEADLQWRVASRFGVEGGLFNGKLVLDAGAGAGDQSVWLQRQGAAVVSLDLSSAIAVVASKMRMQSNWIGIQGDITCLPFGGETFDLIYCEGVIQHTRDSALAVRELLRVLRCGGTILATHYPASTRMRGRLRAAYTALIRSRTSRMPRYPLLLFTGMMAAAAYVPGLRWLVRRSGTAQHSNLMPDFKTTWTNTFDWYGTHSFQRLVPAGEFRQYLERAATIEVLLNEPGVIRARKIA